MNQEYTKFIILTSQRSGSTYFTHLIGSHPNVIAYGESLNEYGIGWGKQKSGIQAQKRKQGFWLPIRNLSPRLFLNLAIFHAYPSNIHAVGFKLMYSQILFFPQVIQYLKQENVRIIHLKRYNLLEMYVSLKRSEVSDTWHTTNAIEAPDVRLYLDPNKCHEYFVRIHSLQQKYNSIVPYRNMLSLSYEDLMENKTKLLNDVQEFLNLRNALLSSRFQKMNRLSLEDCVINYTELKHAFQRTQWKSFFSD